ncbi:MAG: hypothetical protein QOK36_1206, partial [Gaiellales bacterium]|nr:hypothetical protein [Gaiellales bacterium]
MRARILLSALALGSATAGGFGAAARSAAPKP